MTDEEFAKLMEKEDFDPSRMTDPPILRRKFISKEDAQRMFPVPPPQLVQEIGKAVLDGRILFNFEKDS